MVVLLPAVYARGNTIKPQSVQQAPQVTQGGEGTPLRPGRERRAGDSVKHPRRDDRAGAVGHSANGHALATTLLDVVDGHAAPDERVPTIVNLASVTDAGRMNGALW